MENVSRSKSTQHELQIYPIRFMIHIYVHYSTEYISVYCIIHKDLRIFAAEILSFLLKRIIYRMIRNRNENISVFRLKIKKNIMEMDCSKHALYIFRG